LAEDSDSTADDDAMSDRDDWTEGHALGVRFFQQGYRHDALPFLEQSLNHPLSRGYKHMEAAVLLAESYRGMGDFARARAYYEQALAMSRQNLSYYRIRAQFGLITVLRRTLSDDHDYVLRLIQEARGWAVEPRWSDLPAQVEVAEGLYCRQRGDTDEAADRLRRGMSLIEGKSRPFVLFHPEHIEAFLVLCYLCNPGSAARAARHAHQVLAAQGLPWSTAITAAALLRLRLMRIAAAMGDGERVSLAEARPEVMQLLEELDRGASREGDPFLLSEAKLLRTVWAVLSPDRDELLGLRAGLVATLDGAPPATVLLRAVELGALARDIEHAGGPPEIDRDFARAGLTLLDAFRARLRSYGMSEEDVDTCRELIAGNGRRESPLGLWDSSAVRELRCRTWP
jgi:tetratricopeptide (TPR) repeat protein